MATIADVSRVCTAIISTLSASVIAEAFMEVFMMWYLKQLLPLTYRSVYEKAGKKYFAVWNMWFGRVFNNDEYEIVA